MKVPQHRIPKVALSCMKCGHWTRIIWSVAFAEGYHRRHACQNPACAKKFYSLTRYDMSETQVQFLPFKDRALTSTEMEERLAWQAEAADTAGDDIGTVAVPLRTENAGSSTPRMYGKANDIAPLFSRAVAAYAVSEKDRSEAEAIIIAVLEELQMVVDRLDQGTASPSQPQEHPVEAG